ncbi:GNAT family N-acetyltransferase [Chitinophaga sp.]|uniref:GNAT family N-acetyltransferase n=1 Tax=Chitinophaga sp. TaxID=1869181 RepID=UPI0031DDEFB0
MMYQITHATTQDISIIQELTNLIWPATYLSILTQEQMDYMIAMMYNTEELTRQLTSDHTFLLLWDGDRAIGFAGYSPKEEPGVYKLNKIYLHPDYQGKGAGKFLLNTVIDAVKATGAHLLELNVNKYNKARSFYEKIGFEVYEEKDIDIGNGYWMNDFIMRKAL